MKNIGLLFFCCLLVIACKTDDDSFYDKFPEENGFWVNNDKNKLYETDFAFKMRIENDVNLILINTKSPLSDLFDGINVTNLTFQSTKIKIEPGNYTFKKKTEGDFNKTKNFNAAMVTIKPSVSNSKKDIYDRIISGTVRVEHNSDFYNFYYDLSFKNDNRIIGKYEGLIINF